MEGKALKFSFVKPCQKYGYLEILKFIHPLKWKKKWWSLVQALAFSLEGDLLTWKWADLCPLAFQAVPLCLFSDVTTALWHSKSTFHFGEFQEIKFSMSGQFLLPSLGPNWACFKAVLPASYPMPLFPLCTQQDSWSLVRCQVSICHYQTFLGVVILSAAAILSDMPDGDSLIEGIKPKDFAFSQLGNILRWPQYYFSSETQK